MERRSDLTSYPLVATSHKYALKHCSLDMTLAAHGRLFLIQNPCTRHVCSDQHTKIGHGQRLPGLLKETNAVHLQQSYEPSPATKFTLSRVGTTVSERTVYIIYSRFISALH
ncbi:hypothetical protein GWK47_028730 [Chionoecetes opilio]|uniref:Uncharacterized protein n=1 Tax=Chionoecetes opilio TaxID=41210 RepID=A0A8J4YLW9_CHIOP|nr:hypothetical protein GWK47_028730 [Chionoecetes opilio]